MNELIQKFVKQSTHKILGVDQVDQAEFAELIVRECIKAYNHDGFETPYEQDLLVLEHFGIE